MPLTCTRIIVDLRGYRKISVHLRTLSIDYHYPKTRPLGFILSESSVGVICLELLQLLEVRLLLY